MSELEIIKPIGQNHKQVKAAIFDFDGTVSTLRQGWEDIMEPLMVEMISGPVPPEESLIRLVRNYIDESAGIQTIHQMIWLVEQVKKSGRNPEVHDAWWYKEKYNERLMEQVTERAEKLVKGSLSPEDYRIKGSYEFMKALYQMGLDIYIASGTDDSDVKREVESIGIHKFVKLIAGAPPRKIDCSKEAVVKDLLENQGLKGGELLIIGDGKVEISVGVAAGAITIGAATDELKRCGINESKREKLIRAGAHAITGDFERYEEILQWLGLMAGKPNSKVTV